jgi:hypothetical protein
MGYWRRDMKTTGSARTVRRSLALSRQLVEEAAAVAPPDVCRNLNRLVTLALQEYAAARRARAFEEAMTEMARDPAIQTECSAISRELAAAHRDGLKDE